MRVALVSDIHSNRAALEAVFQRITELGVSRIFCLGDVVGYGPDPEFCVDLIRGHAEVCLMGNHDEAVFRDASDFNPHARGAIEYTRKKMKPWWWSRAEKKQRYRWLEQLPVRYTEGRFQFVHGSPRYPVREYVLSTDGFLNPDKLRAVFDSFEGVAVAGHTHHPGMHDESLRFHGLPKDDLQHDRPGEYSIEIPAEGKYFLNVGSVGQPRDGDPRACFAVLEDERITWYRVPYDIRATQQRIFETGELSEVLARRLEIGK